ncbi:MAG: hypothetical protein RLY86_2579 [Pseudomonadota bacterium]|jgi:Rrf2 family protein
MLSSKAKYALRALTRLAMTAGTGAWTLSEEIARMEDIPPKFLEAILTELRAAELVASKRGRAGGYRLERHPHRVTAGEVIRLVDGQLALTPCSRRRDPQPCADCTAGNACSLRTLLIEARDALATILDRCTLTDLVRQREGGAQVLDFSI